MAAPTTITKLPAVVRSPSTLQYLPYKSKVAQPKPYFKPRFTLHMKDREHTLLGHPAIKYTDPLMPPYPYGPNKNFPEANFGLYGGATIQSGSKISKGRNKGKTLRHWFPNVRVETIRSEALDIELKLPITARVMRTIRKCGGIDEYVLGSKPARLKELGLLGWKLRWLVMMSPKYQEKHAQELKRYNLPEHYSLTGTFEDAWNDPDIRSKMITQQEAAWEDLRQAAGRFEKHVQRNWVDSGEKVVYEIPKLESLARNGPSTLGLPQELEKPPTPSPARWQKEILERARSAAASKNTVPDPIEAITTSMEAQALETGVAPRDTPTSSREHGEIADETENSISEPHESLLVQLDGESQDGSAGSR